MVAGNRLAKPDFGVGGKRARQVVSIRVGGSAMTLAGRSEPRDVIAQHTPGFYREV
jgi:hypothetical protein